MDPTESERQQLTTMGKVFQWAGLQEAQMADPKYPSSSLAALLGVQSSLLPRVIGILPEDDYKAVVSKWKVSVLSQDGSDTGQGRAPTVAELGMAHLVGRACRVIAGNGTTVEELRAQALAAQTQLQQQVQQQSVQAASGTPRKVKLNAVLSQVDESEILVADEKQMIKAYLRYESVFGKDERPPKDSEPTAEQVSCIQHLLSQGHPPYCDFSVFGPYGHRMMKKIKLSGLTIGTDGQLKTVELQGPQSISMWLQSYQVLSNALVMLDAVDLGTLQKYREKIEKYHDRYGDKIWAVLYQADVRCRLELMERTKRNLAAKHDVAVQQGTTTSYDPQRPWNLVWQTVISDDSFWKEEVTEPGILILTKVAGISEMVEGDASVGGPSSSSNPRGSAPTPTRLTDQDPKIRPRNPNRTGRYHQVESGKYLVNRTGYKICQPFNEEKCVDTVQGTWCANSWDTVHQCERCLGSHPRTKCPHTDMPQPSFLKAPGRGRGGKGRGGRKGKSGRKAQY